MRGKQEVRCLFCLALCLGIMMCASCSAQKKSPDRVLSELLAACDDLPGGEIFHSGAEEGREGYLPSSLLRAMYGEDAEPLLRGCAFSIYLSSFAEPIEIAVVRTESRTDARAGSALFLCRKDELRVALRHTEFAPLMDEICVTVSGRYVVMGVTKDGKRFSDAVRRAIS